MPGKQSNDGVIRLIAIFKLLKVVSLIAVGIAALKLARTDPGSALDQWVMRLGLNPGEHYLDQAIGKAASLPPNKFKDVGLGSFVYAALFFTEGLGLWLAKPWAEWFTTIITGSLVPVEMYEIYRHPTAVKAVVVLINVAVVVYLIVRIRKQHEGKGE